MIASACSSRASQQSEADPAERPDPAGDPRPVAPPPAPLALGKDDLAGFAYSRGQGVRPIYQRALAAEAAGEWAAVEEACREALLVEPGHLEAHFSLSVALIQQQRLAEALEPLSAAIAGDFLRWGERSLDDPVLAPLLADAEGARYRQLVDAYRDRFRQALGESLLVVGRRGAPWYPRAAGDGDVNHRGEIYAYHPPTGRYLRVSRTDGTVVGFVRSPTGGEVAYVSYRRVWTPGAAEEAAGARPHIREARVGTVDLDTARGSEREVAFEALEWLELGYAADGALIARVRPVAPARGAPLVQLRRLDVAAGAAIELADEAPEVSEALRVAYDRAELRRAAIAGVVADWDDDGTAGAFRLDATNRTISLPAGELADRDTLAWSPRRSRLAFATRATDPCARQPGEGASTLYLVEAATGRLRPLAVAAGAMTPVWLDDDRLAYVDGAGLGMSVRLVDVASGGELSRLAVRGGVGTRWIARDPAACPDAAPDDDGDNLHER